jgi:branched-chain amino acid aminotransferase
MDAAIGADLTVETDTAPGVVPWVTKNPAAGVYEADRTYPGPRILKFDEHLDRLEASARREGLSLHVDRSRFRSVLRELSALALAEDGVHVGNGPLRSTVADPSTGGADAGSRSAPADPLSDAGESPPPADGVFSDAGARQLSVRFLVRAPESRPGELELVLEPFRPPLPELYVQGVACATMIGARRENPEAKTSGWINVRQAFTLPAGTYEGLLVSEQGEILEGAASNFYAIVDGELRTADRDVLLGIARQIVLDVAPGIVPVRLEPIRRSDLARVSEAFLTSSSRAVLPISSIDGTVLGGRGPVTGRIAEAYRAWVESHLAPL